MLDLVGGECPDCSYLHRHSLFMFRFVRNL